MRRTPGELIMEALQVIYGILSDDVSDYAISHACSVLHKTHPRSGWKQTANFFYKRARIKDEDND